MDSYTRKGLLAAGTAGVAAAALGSEALASVTGSGGPTLPPSPVQFSFGLAQAKPDVVTPYGTVTKCTIDQLPALEGSDAAILLLRMKPGALREPHWHPNAWELDYCVSGHVQMGIIDPAGAQAIFDLKPGNLAFV